jgi:hypothetical protein
MARFVVLDGISGAKESANFVEKAREHQATRFQLLEDAQTHVFRCPLHWHARNNTPDRILTDPVNLS